MIACDTQAKLRYTEDETRSMKNNKFEQKKKRNILRLIFAVILWNF